GGRASGRWPCPLARRCPTCCGGRQAGCWFRPGLPGVQFQKFRRQRGHRSRAMPTVTLVPEDSTDPIVVEVFADIKATKKIDFIPAIWRALATHPPHLQLCWTRLKAIMQPGRVDLLTKEIIALAVSVTNSCRY